MSYHNFKKPIHTDFIFMKSCFFKRRQLLRLRFENLNSDGPHAGLYAPAERSQEPRSAMLQQAVRDVAVADGSVYDFNSDI